MGERRSITTFLLISIWLIAPAGPARAALWVEFEPDRAHPGTLVTGRTMGTGALTVGEGRAFPVYFVSDSSDDRTPIGHLLVDARGNGTLEFEVPDISGDDYTVLMSCPPCAPYSAGRTEVPIGEFRVIGNDVRLPVPPPSQGLFTSIAVLVAFCLLLSGLLLYPRRRARGSRA